MGVNKLKNNIWIMTNDEDQNVVDRKAESSSQLYSAPVDDGGVFCAVSPPATFIESEKY